MSIYGTGVGMFQIRVADNPFPQRWRRMLRHKTVPTAADRKAIAQVYMRVQTMPFDAPILTALNYNDSDPVVRAHRLAVAESWGADRAAESDRADLADPDTGEKPR